MTKTKFGFKDRRAVPLQSRLLQWELAEVYTGKFEVKMFTGDPSGFLITGRGIIGTSWDGWALMNGQMAPN
jgi:hypothetical protein